MNILVVAGHYTPLEQFTIKDGLSKFCCDAAKALALDGHQVTLVCTNDSTWEYPGVNIYKLSINSKRYNVTNNIPVSKLFSNKIIDDLHELRSSKSFDVIINSNFNINITRRIKRLWPRSKIINNLHMPASNLSMGHNEFRKFFLEAKRSYIFTPVAPKLVEDYNKSFKTDIFKYWLTSAIYFPEDKPKQLVDIKDRSGTDYLGRLDESKSVHKSLEPLSLMQYNCSVIGSWSPHLNNREEYQNLVEVILSKPNMTLFSNIDREQTLDILRHSLGSINFNTKEALGLSIIEHNLNGCPVLGSKANLNSEYAFTFIDESFLIDTYRKRQNKINEMSIEAFERMLDSYNSNESRQKLSDLTYERFNYKQWLVQFYNLYEQM